MLLNCVCVACPWIIKSSDSNQRRPCVFGNCACSKLLCSWSPHQSLFRNKITSSTYIFNFAPIQRAQSIINFTLLRFLHLRRSILSLPLSALLGFFRLCVIFLNGQLWRISQTQWWPFRFWIFLCARIWPHTALRQCFWHAVETEYPLSRVSTVYSQQTTFVFLWLGSNMILWIYWDTLYD